MTVHCMMAGFFLLHTLSIVYCADSTQNSSQLLKAAIEKFNTTYCLAKVISSRNYYDDYVLVRPPIVSSEAGSIFKAHNLKKPTQSAAIKMVELSKVKMGLARAERELRLLKFLQHERLVKAFDVYKWNGFLIMAMEWLEKGTLNRYSFKNKNHEVMPAFVAVGVMRQIAQGLQYLHSFNIIHRDIKPDNIMLGCCAKIIDFGLCTKMKETDVPRRRPRGTPIFVPLEAYGNEGYRNSLDIYALGLTLMLLFFDPMPLAEFMVVGSLMEKLRENGGPWGVEISAPISDPLQILLRRCICKQPNKRPSADELLTLLSELKGANDEQVEQYCS